MNNYLFVDAVSYLDVDLLKKHLEKKERLRINPSRKRKRNIIRWAAAVAAWVCMLCGTNMIIQYIPVRYELEYIYGGSNGVNEFVLDKNVWIYYVDHSSMKRERVTLPCNAENVFITWKHLNHIGDEVHLLEYELISNTYESTTDYEGEGVANNAPGNHYVLNITVSANMKDYADSDILLSSLKKTMTDYLKINIEVVNIYFE